MRQYRNPLLDRVKLEKPIPTVIPGIPTPKCKIYNHGSAFYSTFVLVATVIMNEEPKAKTRIVPLGAVQIKSVCKLLEFN